MTLQTSLLLLAYILVAFFILSIKARVITGVVYSGEIYLLPGEMIKSAKMSFVAEVLGTLVAFIFNKIDIYNAHKKPPTDPNK